MATGGNASQSSTYMDSGVPAAAWRAIDGIPGHEWDADSCTMTGTEMDAWWSLDMQKVVDVEIVRISNRKNMYQRLSLFEIRIGMNPTDFSQNALCYNMSEIAPSGETMNYPCVNITRGRYVSIQRYSGNSTQESFRGVQMCEVQIIPALSDTSPYNIAPYGIANQSSVTWEGYASRSIDGFAIPRWGSGYSCSQTGQHPAFYPGWWMLDLGHNVTVNLVRLTNRNKVPERLFNFEIRVGFDPIDFTENSLCFYMPGMVGKRATEDFPCILPTRGHYLSIQRIYPLGSEGNLQMCEVEVFQIGC